MLIDPMQIQGAAVADGPNIPLRMSYDDPTLTYEEVVLYCMCRYSSGLDTIDPDESFTYWKKGGQDREWLELKASKTHKMVIEHPWDEIFPTYKQRMEKKNAVQGAKSK